VDTTSDLAGKLREKHPRRDQLSGSCVHLQSERLQCVKAQYRLAVLLAEDTDYGAVRSASPILARISAKDRSWPFPDANSTTPVQYWSIPSKDSVGEGITG